MPIENATDNSINMVFYKVPFTSKFKGRYPNQGRFISTIVAYPKDRRFFGQMDKDP